MGLDLASTDNPIGFAPWEKVISARWYAIVTANAVEVNIGDSMEIVGEAVATPMYGTLPKVITEETGAAGTIVGVCLNLLDSDGHPTQRIAATTTGNSVIAGYAFVADSPQQLYVVQEDGDTSSLQVADIGQNIDAVKTETPSASNGYLSTMELDSNTMANTSTLAYKIVGIHPDDTISSDGSAGNNCRFIVKVNSAYLGDALTGV